LRRWPACCQEPSTRYSSIKANRLWIASGQNGVGRIDRPGEAQPAVRAYTPADGLSSSEVWCLAEGEQGRIYAGTAQGVDRLDPGTGLIAHYSSADGLVSGDIRAALCDRSGDLWFVSPRGVSRLGPERASTLPPLRAASVSAADRFYGSAEALRSPA